MAIDLVVLLDTSGGHAVDDGVPSRIHVANGQADGQQGEEHDYAEPQDNVEDDRVGLVVLLGQVDLVVLQEKKLLFQGLLWAPLISPHIIVLTSLLGVTTLTDELLLAGGHAGDQDVVLLGSIDKLSELLGQQISGFGVGGGSVLVSLAEGSQGQTDQDETGKGGIGAGQLLGQRLDGGQLGQELLVLSVDRGLQSRGGDFLGHWLDLSKVLRDDGDLEGHGK